MKLSILTGVRAVGSCAIVLLVAAANAQVAATLPEGVVARQGDGQVTMQDIDAYAKKIPETDRPGFFDSPKRIESVIMSMLLQKQLAAEARKQKLDADPIVMVEMQQAADDALARAAQDSHRKSLKMPDFELLAQEYYQSHKDEFTVHGAIDVKHVLVSTKERSDADAKQRIAEVEAAAHAHPDQFDALVEKYSDDPSKKDNSGLIENAATGTVGPFAEAVKALKKPGDISPATKTQFGYHVIKLVARKPDTRRSFDDAHSDLVAKLRQDYLDRQAKDYLNGLRGKPLDANPDLVAAIRTRFLPAGAKLPSELAAEANEANRKKAAQDAAAKQDTGKQDAKL